MISLFKLSLLIIGPLANIVGEESHECRVQVQLVVDFTPNSTTGAQRV